MDLGDGAIVIDGFCTAMFINHSCEGNAETSEDEQARVWITALRDIPADGEITYDYCLYEGGDDPLHLLLRSTHLPRLHVLPSRNQTTQSRSPRRSPQSQKETRQTQSHQN